MSHAYVSCYIHYVFSTKDRRPLIATEMRDRLWAYLGGIAKTNGMEAVSIGGVLDHIHLLLGLPSTMPIAKAVQLVKGGSSKWVHETFPASQGFAWQAGYGAFSVGVASLDSVIQYIQNQEAHHQTRTFQEEFLAFLKHYQLPYDDQYIWD